MSLKSKAIVVLVISLNLIIFGLIMTFITGGLYWLSFVFLPMFWLAISVAFLLLKKE